MLLTPLSKKKQRSSQRPALGIVQTIRIFERTLSFAVLAVHTYTDIAQFTLAFVASTRVHTKLAASTKRLTLVYVHALPGVNRKLKAAPTFTHYSSIHSSTVLFTSTIFGITRLVSCAFGEKKTRTTGMTQI